MTNTDLSDEAMCEFALGKEIAIGNLIPLANPDAYGDGIELGWSECRRRAQIQIQEAFKAGWNASGKNTPNESVIAAAYHEFLQKNKNDPQT